MLQRAVPVACVCIAAAASAQEPPPEKEAATLPPVVVTGRNTENRAGVAGFGDIPLSSLPLQASVFSAATLRDRGAQRLADLVADDASLGDAYNATGYWDILSIRGFTLDNRSNFRRDGLPINAETSIPLDNKARIEVLKGLSGLQAGVSAPGGLVNFVVKRPEANLRSAAVSWRQAGSLGAGVDLSQRFGEAEAHGLRINAAYEDLEPRMRNAQGHRHLLAAAGDWRLTPDATLEAEWETSRRVQPSAPGFSLLGNVVPEPGDPTLNLNNQPWSLPVVFDADTASLRWKQRLGADWWGSVHAATQRLRTDDRVAFPFGCSAENLSNRYCSDGSFDLYDFRSEGERRRTDALELALDGEVKQAAFTHTLHGGVLLSRASSFAPPQAFNPVGPGRADGTAVTEPAPLPSGQGSTRRERSTEAYLRGRTRWDERSQLWWGLRHTRLARSGGDADYSQGFTTPWLAYGHDLQPLLGAGWLGYVSWGQGVETAVTPNLPQYTRRGAPLPALRSRQAEAGLKVERERWNGSLAAFEIRRPQTADVGTCDPDAGTPTCDRVLDGTQRHRGLDAAFEARAGAATRYGASATLLAATRAGSVDPAVNGKRPVNVPRQSLRARVSHDPAALPGLRLSLRASHDSDRTVLPGNDDLRIPGWTRVDAGFQYEPATGAGPAMTWRGGIDNLANRRAWRESPYQFGHAYLFPMAPRTAWLTLELRL